MKLTKIVKANIQAHVIFNANDTMLSVEECAKFLNVHPNTIKNRIHKRTIVAKLMEGRYHIPKLQFLDILIDLYEKGNKKLKRRKK